MHYTGLRYNHFTIALQQNTEGPGSYNFYIYSVHFSATAVTAKI